jgi:hypothetical protein
MSDEKLALAPLCCGNCLHFSPYKEGAAFGRCQANQVHVGQFTLQPIVTLDLGLCTKWQKREDVKD